MTIKEVAERTGISADTLRYYERMGLIPPVPRTASGTRNYSEEFIDWITFVQQLKGIGMSLEAIVDYLELARQGNGNGFRRHGGPPRQRGGTGHQRQTAGGGCAH